MSKSRAYVFTVNNYTEEDEKVVRNLEGKYVVYGREFGEENKTPHLQGYVYFATPRSFLSVSKKLPRAHIEVAKGTAEQNRAYCTKQGDYYEKGVMPEKNGGDTLVERAKKNKRLLEEDLMVLVADGTLPVNQIPIIKKARLIMANEKPMYDSENVRGLWICGPPGTGKTHSARTDYGGPVFIKSQNKWFDGYQGEKVIVMDDFDKQGACLGHYLKIWTDRWACTGEVKGGTVPLQHDKFIITSNYTIPEIFQEDPVLVKALERRFQKIELKIKHTN